MADDWAFCPDHFPCGCLVSQSSSGDRGGRRIIYANRYFYSVLDFPEDSLVGQPLSALLTPSSSLFFDSYVVPILRHERHCEEVLLDIRMPGGGKVPVVLNAVMNRSEDELIYWSLFDATQRDRLYQELVDARRRLEESAQKLHEQSITDELTGLVNRHELKRRSNLVFEQARRNHSSVAMLVLDIDFFKRINDELGHAGGDEILKECGRVLKEESRANDITARFGGEEFVIVLPETDAVQAQRIAARLHTVFRQIRAGDRPVTVSIGVGIIDGSSEEAVTFSWLFEKADRAVYEAKRKGRDRTVTGS